MQDIKQTLSQQSAQADAQEQAMTAKQLSPEAERALAEAAQRRAIYDAQAQAAKPLPEVNGREGPEAIRYGDWESKGIASDF
jgi:hypothetical protein